MISLARQRDEVTMAPFISHSKPMTCHIFRRKCANLHAVETEGEGVLSVTGIAAKKAGADFPETVYATAKTAIALFDAFIQCWNEKYTYNTVRPETVINKYFDANWRPELQTPPFPEYTCGHCTISASAAEALTSIFGDNFPYTDSTELEFGIPSRNFTSFRQAAQENEKARFYGGLHYWYSCGQGHNSGIKVGNLVVEKLKMKK